MGWVIGLSCGMPLVGAVVILWFACKNSGHFSQVEREREDRERWGVA